MTEAELIAAVKLTSVPLRKLDEKGEVIGNASGCLVEYFGHRLLLSVSHKSLKEGNWAVEVDYDQTKGTRLYQVGGLNYIRRVDVVSGERQKIDFSYASVPKDLVSRYQEIGFGGFISKDEPRFVFKQTFDTEPDKENLYAFSGQTKHCKENWFLCSTIMAVIGLTYDRTEGDFYFFKLPTKHPGHEEFQGCSGAPIFDTDWNVVALVCGGTLDDDMVYGIALKKLKVILDIHVGRFGK